MSIDNLDIMAGDAFLAGHDKETAEVGRIMQTHGLAEACSMMMATVLERLGPGSEQLIPPIGEIAVSCTRLGVYAALSDRRLNDLLSGLEPQA